MNQTKASKLIQHMNRRQPMAGKQQRGRAAAYGYKLSTWLRQVLVELGEAFMSLFAFFLF